MLEQPIAEIQNHATAKSLASIDINRLTEFKFGNSRKIMSESSLKELAESLKRHFINPITVRPTEKNTYEVLAGNRRWAAAKIAGLKHVPVNILNVDDKEAYEVHIRENADRENISLVEEAKAAQQFVSLYEGNYELAAQQLKWSVKIVKDRLNLLRCSDEVLDALEEGKIELGHAIVLSSFTEKLQNGTLANILKEKWTVKYLKERAGKAKKRIANAKFNTNECVNCPHNTVSQNDMFSIGVEADAQCANLPCWKQKTDDWLAEQRKTAEERFGKVLLWVESGESDRNTVAASVVGESQYSEGCVNCESNVVIMDDRDRREGELIQSQCIDKICFSKCVKAFEQSKKPKTEQTQTTTKPTTDTASPKPNKVDEATISVASKPTAKVIDHEKSTLAKAALAQVKDSPVLTNSLIFALVSELTGYNGLGDFKASMFNDKVKKLQSESAENLIQHTLLALQGFLSNATVKEGDFSAKTPARLLVSVLETLGNSKAIAIAQWQADEETLNNYRVAGIIELCQKSGFIEAFNKEPANIEAKMDFEKLAKRSKSKLIKGIVDFGFDWSGFAPQSYLSHLRVG